MTFAGGVRFHRQLQRSPAHLPRPMHGAFAPRSSACHAATNACCLCSPFVCLSCCYQCMLPLLPVRLLLPMHPAFAPCPSIATDTCCLCTPVCRGQCMLPLHPRLPWPMHAAYPIKHVLWPIHAAFAELTFRVLWGSFSSQVCSCRDVVR